MIYWIKRFATLLGFAAFFILLLIGMLSSGQLSWECFVPACARALGGALLLWIVGIVVADILLKGIVTDIEIDKKCLVDGGLLQQVHSIREKSAPAAPKCPLSRESAQGNSVRLKRRDFKKQKEPHVKR